MQPTLEEIYEFCDLHGVDHKESSGHIVFRYCPSCDSEKWKVSLFEESLRGKCFRCDETFSVQSYLYEFGVEPDEIKKLFKKSSVAKDQQGLISLTPIFSEETLSKEKGSDNTPSVDLSSFMKIEDWPDHPASLYAQKRGVTPDLHSQIMISTHVYGVVFLSHDYETKKCNGYQIRFVNPLTQAKTYNLPGFQTAENIIIYEREGADAVICEGPFNAVSAYNYGFTGIATFGSNFSARQAEMIIDFVKKRGCKLYSGFDMDEAGEKAFFIMKDVLDERGIQLLKIVPETGNDLNDSWMAGKGYTITTDFEGSHFSLIGGLFENRKFRKG